MSEGYSVELLALQVQQLTLRVTALEQQLAGLPHRRNDAPEEFELVSEVNQPVASSRTTSNSSVYNSLAAEIPVVSSAALHLCANLRGGRLSARERATRAWSAGYWARFVLEGKVSKPRPSSPCDLANTTYIILKAEGVTTPLRAEKASDYRALLGDFLGDSLSHGFASQAEAKTYCLGAGVAYPTSVYRWS